MDLRQAEHFLAVIDHGGISRAASVLNLAQPSLSQSIRVLERELGTPLFRRSARGMVPTAAAEGLIGPARRLLRDLATARASVAEHAGLFGGHLDIGAVPQAFDAPLPELVGRLREQFPSVTFRLREYASEQEMMPPVRTGMLDLGIGYCDVDADGRLVVSRGLVAEPLAEQPAHLAMPAEVARDLQDPLPFDKLPDLPVIAITEGAVTRNGVEAALRREGQRTRLGVVSTHRHLVLPLIAMGQGMCWVAEAQTRAMPDGVATRRMDPPITFTLALFHRPGLLTPWARAFFDEAVRWGAAEAG